MSALPTLSTLQAPDFSRITPADYQQAITQALVQGRAAQAALAADPTPPTVANTLVPLERLMAEAQEAYGVFLLASFDRDPALVAVEEALAEPYATFFTQLFQDAGLWGRIQTLAADPNRADWPAEDDWLLTQTERRFRLNGAHLSIEAQQAVQQHGAALADLSVAFGKKALAAAHDPYWVYEPTMLAGLSDERITEARAWATELGQEGWAFHWDMPNARAALEESTSALFRQGMWAATQERNWSGPHDTTEIIRQTLIHRTQLAQVLGFETWADFALSDMMAQTPAQAEALMAQVWAPTVARFEAEASQLAAVQRREAPEQTLTAADWLYWAERVRQDTYDFDAQQMRAYFPRQGVRAGLFDVASRLFGVSFTEQPQLPTYVAGVEPYLVHRGDTPVGVLYIDDFQRSTKRSGAWMEMARAQSSLDGVPVLPVVGNALNVVAPASGDALLTVDEVLTAYHELGHGLHALLSQVRYPSQSGTNVPTDFVELPSQLLENWAMQPEVLAKWARHHEDGSALPAEMLRRWQAANQFNGGFFQGEYLLSAYMDLRLHQVPLEELTTLDFRAFQDQVRADLGCPEALHPRYGLAHFTHLFESGYSARYYAYLWSEVLDADVFARFEAEGLFDPVLGAQLQEYIYASGNTRPVEASFTALMGRNPDATALLKRKGFASEASVSRPRP